MSKKQPLRFIRHAAVRERALRASRELRAGKFTRVSAEWLAFIDARVDLVIEQEVRRHPTVGVTLKP